MTTSKGALVPSCPPGEASPTPKSTSPAPARSVAASRSRRAWEVANRNSQAALQHGCFAVTANERDASVEVALLYATHPGLDALADRRLVEQLALASVQHRRALIAVEADGLTSTLTSYVTRLAALIERLEAKVHQREQDRIATMRRGDSMIIQLQAKR